MRRKAHRRVAVNRRVEIARPEARTQMMKSTNLLNVLLSVVASSSASNATVDIIRNSNVPTSRHHRLRVHQRMLSPAQRRVERI